MGRKKESDSIEDLPLTRATEMASTLTDHLLPSVIDSHPALETNSGKEGFFQAVTKLGKTALQKNRNNRYGNRPNCQTCKQDNRPATTSWVSNKPDDGSP